VESSTINTKAKTNHKIKGSIVILTGAGISAESGIQTFRGADGLWEGHRVEDVASPEGFAADQHLVLNFYNQRRAQLTNGDINPNPAHIALAKLEAQYNGDVLLVTQNVDDLHERAGSKNLLHMHGELLKGICASCGDVTEVTGEQTTTQRCTQCGLQSLRPDIVWFGEMPKYMDEIENALSQCELFVSIGTSGNVYPAAGFVEMAASYGAHTVEVNLEPTNTSSNFAEHIHGRAGDEVPIYVDGLLRV
jgi:NAD-dependent deacetylase|tara:strand:- start:170 stop:916 length:747 start_codon:yes stop_codon:yes gene_type:complete